jgi:trimeric autotransporter adhesin
METPASETARTNESNYTNRSRNSSLNGIGLTMNRTNPNVFLQVPYPMQQAAAAMFATPMQNINNNAALSPMMMTIGADPSLLPPRRVTLHLGWTSESMSSSSGHTKKIRKVLRDSQVSVQDWLYDLMTNEVQHYQLQELVDSLDGYKRGADASSFTLSLGPQRSMVMDMNIEVVGKKRKRTNEGIIPCIRMELVTYSSEIVLSPRDPLYDLLESSDENLVLKIAGEGSWFTNEGGASTNTTISASKKAKRGLDVVDTKRTKAEKSEELKAKESKKGVKKDAMDSTEAKWKKSKVVEKGRSNKVGGSINNTTPASKKAKKGHEKNAKYTAEAEGNKVNIDEEGKFSEDGTAINSITPTSTKNAEKDAEKSAGDTAETKGKKVKVDEEERSSEGGTAMNNTTPAAKKAKKGSEKSASDAAEAKRKNVQVIEEERSSEGGAAINNTPSDARKTKKGGHEKTAMKTAEAKGKKVKVVEQERSNEGGAAIDNIFPTATKAKKGHEKSAMNTAEAKGKKVEVVEGERSNEGGAPINNTSPTATMAKKGHETSAMNTAEAKGKNVKVVEEDTKAKKGHEKGAMETAEAKGKKVKVVEEERSNEGGAAINNTTPAATKAKKGHEKSAINTAEAKGKKSKEVEETMEGTSEDSKHKTSQSRSKVSDSKIREKPVGKVDRAIKEPAQRKASAGSLSDVKEKKKRKIEVESKIHPREEQKDSKGDNLPLLDLGEWDVLTGTKKDDQSVGNRKYGEYIDMHFRDYRDEKAEGKKDITQTIMTKFTFYRIDKKSDEWKLVEAGESIRKKVQNDLRNRIKRETIQTESEEMTVNNNSQRKNVATDDINAVQDNEMVQTKSKASVTNSSHASGHGKKHDNNISDEAEVGDVKDENGRTEETKKGATRNETESNNSKESASSSNGHEHEKGDDSKRDLLDRASASKDEVEENYLARNKASSLPSNSSSDETSSSSGSSSSSDSSSSSGSDSSVSNGSDECQANNASNKVNAPPKVTKSTPQAKVSATNTMPKAKPLSSRKENAVTYPRAKPEKTTGRTSSTRKKKPLLDPDMKFKFPASKRRMQIKKNVSISETKNKSSKISKESISTNSTKT